MSGGLGADRRAADALGAEHRTARVHLARVDADVAVGEPAQGLVLEARGEQVHQVASAGTAAVAAGTTAVAARTTAVAASTTASAATGTTAVATSTAASAATGTAAVAASTTASAATGTTAITCAVRSSTATGGVEADAGHVGDSVPAGKRRGHQLQLAGILEVPANEHRGVLVRRVVAVLHVGACELTEAKRDSDVVGAVVHRADPIDVLTSEPLPDRGPRHPWTG